MAFENDAPDGTVIDALSAVIAARRNASGDQSYTRQLLDAGTGRCARKFGEEALETVIAALNGDAAELQSEAADVIYHLLVLLEVRGVAYQDVLVVLAQRMGTSGLAEKASRGKVQP